MAIASPKVISLFTGAGGIDLGLEAAGMTTAVAVENDPDCIATLEGNRHWPIIQDDIHKVPVGNILEKAGLAEGAADLLVAGPPCQPYSKSANWCQPQGMNDPRANTLTAMLDVIRETLPKTIFIENVPGLKREAVDFISQSLYAINQETGSAYSLAVGKLNAADYGVPQTRERLFLIAAKDGAVFSFPKPTHGTASNPLNTAGEAIGDLEGEQIPGELRLRGKWADLVPSIPEGHNYLWHTERGGGKPIFKWRSRYWNFLLKLSKDRPSWTIQAGFGPATGPLHWNNRYLSIREICRLQTFPDSYGVTGSYRAARRQLGNAAPPVLIEILARSVRDQLVF